MDGKIVGVAMQAKVKAQSIGYIIPTPIIEHFLTDLQDGHYDGFPKVGAQVQSRGNAALRRSLQLPESETGVYVTQVVPGTSAVGLLKTGDVILDIDNHQLANDGTVLLRPGLRVQSDYFVNVHQVGDITSVTVWRNGAKQA